MRIWAGQQDQKKPVKERKVIKEAKSREVNLMTDQKGFPRDREREGWKEDIRSAFGLDE